MLANYPEDCLRALLPEVEVESSFVNTKVGHMFEYEECVHILHIRTYGLP